MESWVRSNLDKTANLDNSIKNGENMESWHLILKTTQTSIEDRDLTISN